MGRPLNRQHILTLIFIHPFDDSRRLITKQKGTRRYECLNNGTDVFTLVATTSLSQNEAYMLAYDSDGNTYFVTKLTRHRAVLTRKEQVGVPAFQFATGQSVKWVPFYGAISGQTVNIENAD